jgi:predicted nicotinamide N-methyase
MAMNRESFPAPPLEAVRDQLGPLVREPVHVEGHTFILQRPSESDRLLSHPAVHRASKSDDYMPYWADLWPAARMLAKYIRRRDWPEGQLALEVGCGLGLVGIVGLSVGLDVIFSDYDASALHFAAENARLNGFHDFRTMQIDWRCPPEDLRVPIIFAADLIYEVRNIAPLVNFIKTVLLPDGVCYLTDQDRLPAPVLRQTLENEGLPYTTELVRAGEPGGRRLKGTLYRVRKQ